MDLPVHLIFMEKAIDRLANGICEKAINMSVQEEMILWVGGV